PIWNTFRTSTKPTFVQRGQTFMRRQSESRRSTSRVVGNDIARNQQPILAELRRGVDCASDAIVAKNDSGDWQMLGATANAACQKALRLLKYSSLPIEPSIHEKLRYLEMLLGKI